MSKPLDLGRFHILPGRRLVFIVGEVDTRSGSVARLLSLLEKERIRVCSACVHIDGERARLLAFLDVTDSVIPVEEIGRAPEAFGLMKVEAVVKSPAEGFAADAVSSPLTAGSERAVIFRETGYRELLAGIREYYGASGENFLYHIGFRAGMGFGRLHREAAEKLGIRDPELIYKTISTSMFQWAGFGRMQVVEFKQDHGELMVYDSFECKLGKRRSVTYSHFVRGIIAGVLAELFGRAYNVVEEECIAMGAPACRFKVRALPKDKPAQP
ncbi:MAG: 4-vinyl reductase [Candidatus Bathyarchaeia archaeon]|uniref:4-vinyl reductase n=1 Tax=Candidatus Hadarchaeum sp. TaxID=2883567 RepID=UPI00316CD7FA